MKHISVDTRPLSLSLFQSGQSKFCFKNISRDSNLTDNGADSFPFFLFRHSKVLNDVTCSFVTAGSAMRRPPPLKLFLIKFMSCQPIRQSSFFSFLPLIEKYLNAESPRVWIRPLFRSWRLPLDFFSSLSPDYQTNYQPTERDTR